MKKTRVPHCMICKQDWVDIPSAIREQRDHENSTIKTETRGIIIRGIATELIAEMVEDRAMRVDRITVAGMIRMLFAQAIYGYPDRRVEDASGQGSLLDLFVNASSLREFLRRNLCEETCLFGGVNITNLRDPSVDGLLFLGITRILISRR
jgi:hypothetical protein